MFRKLRAHKWGQGTHLQCGQAQTTRLSQSFSKQTSSVTSTTILSFQSLQAPQPALGAQTLTAVLIVTLPMLLTLFPTFFISPSTASFGIYTSAILLAQAFFIALHTLIVILAFPLNGIYWSKTVWSALIHELILGFSVAIQEILDCANAAFVNGGFCLLMVLHGGQSSPGNGRFWSEGDTPPSWIRLEEEKQSKKLPCLPLVAELSDQDRGHHWCTKPTHTTKASCTTLMSLQPTLTATNKSDNEIVPVLLEVLLSTPHQVLSFTQSVRSFIEFSSSFPSPSRSSQLRSRSKCATRRNRARRKTGLYNSSGAIGSLCGLMYGEYSSSIGTENAMTVVAKVLARAAVESLRPVQNLRDPGASKPVPTSMKKDTATTQRTRRREEKYRIVAANLRRFQKILDREGY